MNNAANTLTPEIARLIVAQGCPRTADVKAAKNHVYLSQHGLAGGFQNSDHVRKSLIILDKAHKYQTARRFIEGVNAMAGSSRARYKRQQRPA